jgi:hypothetical protein
MATGRNFSMSGHHYLPTYQILMISDNVEFLPPIFMPCFGSHFENGRHLENLDNTIRGAILHFKIFKMSAIFKMPKIQHCSISSKFDMWVDNDVQNRFPTLKKFYRLPFSKWLPQRRDNAELLL